MVENFLRQRQLSQRSFRRPCFSAQPHSVCETNSILTLWTSKAFVVAREKNELRDPPKSLSAEALCPNALRLPLDWKEEKKTSNVSARHGLQFEAFPEWGESGGSAAQVSIAWLSRKIRSVLRHSAGCPTARPQAQQASTLARFRTSDVLACPSLLVSLPNSKHNRH